MAAMSQEEDNFVKANFRVEDINNMFQIKIVEGQPVYSRNICNEGFVQDDEEKKHIEEDHIEILMQISKALQENEMRELDDDSMKRLSNNDQIDNEESEDDEAFLSRFYKDRNCIC